MSTLISSRVKELINQIEAGKRITAAHIDAFLEDPESVLLEPPTHGTLRLLWRERKDVEVLGVVNGIPIVVKREGANVFIMYGSFAGPRLSQIAGKVSIEAGVPFYVGYYRGSEDACFFLGSTQVLSAPYSFVCDAKLVGGEPLFVTLGSEPNESCVIHGMTWIDKRRYSSASSPCCVGGKYAFIVSAGGGRQVIFNNVPGKIYDHVEGLSIVDGKPLYAARLGEIGYVVHGEVETFTRRGKVIGTPYYNGQDYAFVCDNLDGSQVFENCEGASHYDQVCCPTLSSEGKALYAGKRSDRNDYFVVHGGKVYGLPGSWTAIHEVLLVDKGVKVIAQLGRKYYELVLRDY